MAGIQRAMLHQPCSVAVHYEELEDHWRIAKGDAHYNLASSTSSFEHSTVSSESGSSLDLADDACSSSSKEDFTQLFAQLPIKRGLSMFYQGKSQSFTSLSSVKSIKDVPKKENAYSRRLNACKSYAGGLDTHRSSCYTLPKPPTFKKAPNLKTSLSFVQVRRGGSSCRSPPSIPVYNESF